MRQPEIETTDQKMMRRCIELSREGAARGELPFGAVIVRNGVVLAESTNKVAEDTDVTRHAEMVAISQAQKAVGKRRLRGCTIYSNVEPCVMCSMAIRETGISRVVYSIRSPIMGGDSRWNVLNDKRISNAMPIYFARPPEILSGYMFHEAEKAWSDWRPFIWTLIKLRGWFRGPG